MREPFPRGQRGYGTWVRHVIKRPLSRNGSGCAANVASARLPEEPLQHRLDVAGANPLFHRGSEPRRGMFLPMPPNDVAVTSDLCRILARPTAFDVGPGQMDDDHITFHRLQERTRKSAKPNWVFV